MTRKDLENELKRVTMSLEETSQFYRKHGWSFYSNSKSSQLAFGRELINEYNETPPQPTLPVD